MSELLTAALAYAARGWHVFPTQPRTKKPITRHGHLDASIDPAVITKWWSDCPNANIGLSLAPSGLVALDVDVGEGKGGFEALAKLHAAHPLPDTLTAHTGGGGLHAVYSRPDDCPAKRRIDFLHRIVDDEAKGSGLDLLGQGYILVAPSIHKSGAQYRWGDASAEIVPLPQSLVKAYSAAAPIEFATSDLEAPVAEGGRDNALFKLGCALRDMGLSEASVHAALFKENELRCRPPMAPGEVVRIVQSVMQRVEPSRDVLGDVAFISSILPQSVEFEPLQPEDGRLSVSLDQVAAHESPVVRTIPLGFPELDKALGGGAPTGSLGAIIGPPGTGKTQWGIGILLQSSAPGLLISTELSTNEIKARVASLVLGCPWIDILKGERDADEVRAAVTGLRLQVVGNDLIPDVMEPLELVRAIATEIYAYGQEIGEPPLVVIDYLQDMCRGEDSRDPVGAVTKILRRMAPVLDCAIIAVSATARGWYGARTELEHPVAFMGAGKESGSIEYDATWVAFLDVLPEIKDGSQAARIALAKSRHGTSCFQGARYCGVKGGKWSPDPSALNAFQKESRASDGLGKQHVADDKAVVEALRKMGKAVTQDNLKHKCGIPSSRAYRAILRLKEAGRLEHRQERQTDEDHRTRLVKVIGFPAPPKPPAVDTPDFGGMFGEKLTQ